MSIQYFETEEDMEYAFERTMEKMQDEARKEEEERRAASIENVLQVEWHFYVDCPKCGEQLDLSDGDYDSEAYFSEPIFNNKWDDLKGGEVTCEECGYEFEIHNVEPY